MPYHPVWTLIDDNKRGRPRKENSSGKWAAKLAHEEGWMDEYRERWEYFGVSA